MCPRTLVKFCGAAKSIVDIAFRASSASVFLLLKIFKFLRLTELREPVYPYSDIALVMVQCTVYGSYIVFLVHITFIGLG